MASRLPSAVSYIATVAVTFFLAHELLGASAAPLAALVLATSAGPLLYGRSLFTDTLFGLWLAVSDRKSTRLNSSHLVISYAVFCLKKKKKLCSMIIVDGYNQNKHINSKINVHIEKRAQN